MTTNGMDIFALIGIVAGLISISHALYHIYPPACGLFLGISAIAMSLLHMMYREDDKP